jgi:hypothetical protein
MADGTVEIFDYDLIREKAKKFGGLVERLFVSNYDRNKFHTKDNISLHGDLYVNRNKFGDNPKYLLCSYSATGHTFSLLYYGFGRNPKKERFDYYNRLFMQEVFSGIWSIYSLHNEESGQLRKLYRFIRWCHAKAKLAEWEVWT